MKTIFNLCLLLFSFFAGNLAAQEVKVYYFYTSYRCTNCTNFEKWTAQVVETDFPDSNIVRFCALNIEEKENKHFIEKYKLVTKAVVLVKFVNGKETEWKNLDKIWFNAGKEKKFKAYIRKEINDMLKAKK